MIPSPTIKIKTDDSATLGGCNSCRRPGSKTAGGDPYKVTEIAFQSIGVRLCDPCLDALRREIDPAAETLASDLAAVLAAMRDNPAANWYFGRKRDQARWERLTEALASMTGQPVDAVRKEYTPQGV